MKLRRIRITLTLCAVQVFVAINGVVAGSVIGPFEVGDTESHWNAAMDTIPLQDRYGDFITGQYYNPFDITPSIVEQTVEYDMESGQYVVMEKIGDQFYRTPTYLTMEEYLDWQRDQQEKDYLRKLSGRKKLDFSKGLKIDPMSEIDIEAQLLDRLFGGTEVTIKPTGNIDITMGADIQTLEGNNINERNRRTGGFNFDMDINMGVEGKIGEKMNLGFNYNTQATFDFDNQLNLGYLADAFDEDGIIKTIEAGNISFPLKSQLINGSNDLFGLKTELQFGHFRLTGVASQSRSEAETISLENGKLIQEFELRPDSYDENRHFFISHYNRGNFEKALSTTPQIRSLMRITNVEVWVSTQPNDNLQNATTVAAISYLGESDITKFSDPNTRWLPQNLGDPLFLDVDGNQLPDNKNSQLFRTLVVDEDTRKIINTSTNLGRGQYGLTQVRDFEVQSMRKLRESEYTFFPELGFISLNVRLQPNQVLGVAYEYTYSLNGSNVYKVGELTNESNTGGLDQDNNPEPEDVIYVKMLKSSNQRVDLPSWDLMMKNIYSLNASQLTQEDFLLDIFFEDNATATLKRFIPEPGYDRKPLLELFQLDRLNSRLDPQQDGVFDFVPGITVNSRTGSIIFPVLEPFGNSLLELLDNNQELYAKYGFPDLYTQSLTDAREQLEKNRFLIKGQLKSNFSSEISLGAFNIPQGSVTVRAGSQILREGIDYDIDYGIGRIKILNDAYLQQGVPIKVSFEDQNLFGLQQKTMFGLRGEYEVSDNLIVGATYMRLFERPFTQKVNIGDDPINNRMFGLDVNFTTEAPFLTRLVDKLPFYSTNAESSLSFSAEVAGIKPGHSGAINVPNENEGVVSLDDFEGATSSIPLGSAPTRWKLASTPQDIRNANLINDLAYNNRRALINWYVVNDFSVRGSEDNADPYTRRFDQTELFRRQIDVSQIPDLLTFDVSYYPSEKGPYNFNTQDVTVDNENGELRLSDPESSWGGIMRYIDGNNDFQLTNIQYIEFWLLNPFMDRRDGANDPTEDRGRLVFNLGNVSEDILKDNLQFYENAIPLENENIPIQNTVWGNVPLTIPSVDAFDRTNAAIQDLGLDGMDDAVERIQYSQYIDAIQQQFGLVDVNTDPSNDNFVSFLDERFNGETNLLNRFKRFNNPQGNVSGNDRRIGIGNPEPDTEDLNGNRSLEQSENYYEYTVDLSNDNGDVQGARDNDFITDVRETTNPVTQEKEKWYRFRIPIESPTSVVGNIDGYRSIQFIRMYMTGFKNPKTFRFAEFELVRSQWRTLPIDSTCLENRDVSSVEHVIDEVGVEENSTRTPFNYVLPQGIVQERFVSTFNNILQDENSMSIRVCGLPDSCDAMVYKLTQFDMRQYKRLEMFVHAEGRDETLEDGEFTVFMRIGKDFLNNYYEYEIPMTLSKLDSINNLPQENRSGEQQRAYSAEIWRKENKFDFPLSLFTDAKIERNLSSAVKTEPWRYPNGDPENPNARITIKGNPSLGNVKGIVLGIRSKTGREKTLCSEVWFNELRLKGLNDRGGVAGIARIDMQIADLGSVTMSGNFQSIGFGQIGQQVQERSLERVTEFDFATNLELGKFLPSNSGIRIPFYYQYNKSISQAEFDPYELDLRVDTLKSIEGYPDIEDIDERSKQQTTIQTVNFTNVRKDRTGGKSTPKPWDVENLSVSYSHTKTTYSDEILKEEVTTDQRGDLNYNFTTKANHIMPFKGINAKALRFIKEINFNPIPNAFSFNTQLRRLKNSRLYRLPDPVQEGIVYAFDDRRFDWTRNYSLQWDMAKSLKLNYDASASAVVDELRQVGVAPTKEERNWENEYGEDVTDQVTADPSLPSQYRSQNLMDFGRMKNFNQGVSINYNVPFKFIPGLEWITARATYTSDYIWSAGSLSLVDLIEPEYEGAEPWHTIQNSQSRSINSTFAFDKLYDKIPYFKRLQGGKTSTRARSRSTKDASAEGEGDSKDRKKEREITTVEKIFVRPLLSIRELKFTYRENLSTVIPGFANTPDFFGMNGSSPGWGFVFGLQPDLNIANSNNWLESAASQGWITPTRFQNQQVLQNSSQNYEGRLKVEPWKDFAIDFRFDKSYSRNHAEDFVNRAIPGSGNVDLQQVALRDLGSYKVTYFALGTLFDSDIDGLFKRFESYRAIVSNRLPNDPNSAGHPSDPGYAEGYGRQHVDVLIPSFIAAYTGEDPELVDLDLTKQISSRAFIPKPNWQLRYNGLSKLPWFKELFSNVSISHGYTSTLAVNNYQTDLQYKPLDPFFIDPDISTRNYFARFEIPEVIIEERFQPIIGIDFKTKSNLTANFEFVKSRTLQLSTGLGQINETKSTEYTAGMGWIFDDINIAFLTGIRKSRSKRKKPTDTEEPEPVEDEETRQRNEAANFKKKLQFNFDFGLRDDATYTHEFDSGRDAQATRGTYSLQISPSLDYDINKYFTLRMFMDYNQTKPKTLGGYDVTNVNGGITARFNLQ